jgi:DNA-binding transcriptional LysR family regulator
VPRLIREYRAVNPLVEFSLRNVLTADQGRMLEESSLDLGFLRMPFARGPGVEVVPIHQEPFILVVPSSHPLARKSAVRLRETANETYVLYERAHAPGFHDLVLGNSQPRQCNPGSLAGRWGNGDADFLDRLRNRNLALAHVCREDQYSGSGRMQALRKTPKL